MGLLIPELIVTRHWLPALRPPEDAGELAQLVMFLVYKPEDLCSIPRTHAETEKKSRHGSVFL